MFNKKALDLLASLIRYLVVVVLVIFVLLGSYSTTKAEEQNVSLEIFPSVIHLYPNKSVDVVIILRNSTTFWLQNIQLNWYTDGVVDVEVEPYSENNLQPNGSLALNVRISQKSGSDQLGNLYFKISYIQTTIDNASSLPGIVIGKLEIQETPLVSVEKIAEVKIETALNQVEEQKQGQIFLVIHNLSDIPITINEISSFGPNFINVSVDGFKAGQVISPQTTQTYNVNINTRDTIQTGPQKVIFKVDITWIKYGRVNLGSLSASQTINTAIIGESDILKLLGIPSFLFLPGFLILTTVLTLWKRVFPKPVANFEFTLPEFALISITLSLLAAIAYPQITAIVSNQPRNYLQAYGLKDVFQVWFGSVAFGLVVWIALSGGTSLWQRYRKFQKDSLQRKKDAELTPTQSDPPLVVLNKMEINGVKYPPYEVDVNIDGKPSQYFVVIPAAEGKNVVWVSPTIVLQPKMDSALDNQQYQDQRQSFLKQLEMVKSSKELGDVLSKASNIWNIVWNSKGKIVGPTPIPKEKINNPRRTQRYFYEFD